jgi:Protein of unknown function (DUF2442)
VEYLPVVIDAVYMGDYRIKLEFDNGEQRIVDCEPWLKGDIFQPLKDQKYFQQFFVDGWSISWPNGADIAPETLYKYGLPA